MRAIAASSRKLNAEKGLAYKAWLLFLTRAPESEVTEMLKKDEAILRYKVSKNVYVVTQRDDYPDSYMIRNCGYCAGEFTDWNEKRSLRDQMDVALSRILGYCIIFNPTKLPNELSSERDVLEVAYETKMNVAELEESGDLQKVRKLVHSLAHIAATLAQRLKAACKLELKNADPRDVTHATIEARKRKRKHDSTGMNTVEDYARPRPKIMFYKHYVLGLEARSNPTRETLIKCLSACLECLGCPLEQQYSHDVYGCATDSYAFAILAEVVLAYNGWVNAKVSGKDWNFLVRNANVLSTCSIEDEASKVYIFDGLASNGKEVVQFNSIPNVFFTISRLPSIYERVAAVQSFLTAVGASSSVVDSAEVCDLLFRRGVSGFAVFGPIIFANLAKHVYVNHAEPCEKFLSGTKSDRFKLHYMFWLKSLLDAPFEAIISGIQPNTNLIASLASELRENAQYTIKPLLAQLSPEWRIILQSTVVQVILPPHFDGAFRNAIIGPGTGPATAFKGESAALNPVPPLPVLTHYDVVNYLHALNVKNTPVDCWLENVNSIEKQLLQHQRRNFVQYAAAQTDAKTAAIFNQILIRTKRGLPVPPTLRWDDVWQSAQSRRKAMRSGAVIPLSASNLSAAPPAEPDNTDQL